MLLQTATYDYQLDNKTENIPKRSPTTGAKFSIVKSTDGSATMKWNRSSNKRKPFFSQLILEFVCNKVLPLLSDSSQVKGFTDHNRLEMSVNPNMN